MVKARRRIKRARITHISLCKRGANRSAVLYKSTGDDRGMFEIEAIAKMDDQGLLTTVVVAPGVVFDDGDVVDEAAIIQESCHNWLTECIENGGGIDVSHDEKVLAAGDVQICENFMIQKGDPRFANYEVDGVPTDPTGGWGTIFKINNEQIRAKYRTGDWNGVSMAGPAIVQRIAMEHFPDALADKLGKTTTLDIDMDPKEFEALLAKQAEAITTGVGAAVTAALAKNAEAVTDVITDDTPKLKFDGDAGDLEAVRKHSAALRVAQVDWNDQSSVAKYEAELAKAAAESKAKADGDAGDGAGDGAGELDQETQAQVAKLQKENADRDTEIARLRGSSRQSTDEPDRVEKSSTTASDVKAVRTRAKAAAERSNARRGIAPATSAK